MPEIRISLVDRFRRRVEPDLLISFRNNIGMGHEHSQSDDSHADVSFLLQRLQGGDTTARDQLFRVAHGHLRKLAAGLMRTEPADNTLHVTALVNEACLRLIQQGATEQLQNRRHLFGAATRAMQQVLVDHARTRTATKRGGDMQRQALDVVLDRFESRHKVRFEELEEALARLKNESPRQHEVLTLRFFAGLTIAEAARLMECSESTIESDWRLARAKLHTWLKDDEA